MDTNLLDDLKDLHATIERVLQADDTSSRAAAQQEALALIEQLSVLHCDIHKKVIDSRRDSLASVGWQEVGIPQTFTGHWFVPTEAEG